VLSSFVLLLGLSVLALSFVRAERGLSISIGLSLLPLSFDRTERGSSISIGLSRLPLSFVRAERGLSISFVNISNELDDSWRSGSLRVWLDGFKLVDCDLSRPSMDIILNGSVMMAEK